MTREERALIRQAIEEQRTIRLRYNKPKRGVITRDVRPYELSVNRAKRPVLWGSDSVHGPRQLHGFRLDRIVSVTLGRKEFNKAVSISRHLVNEGAIVRVDDDDEDDE